MALPKMAGMETVFLEAEHVMAMLTVILELMKLIADLLLLVVMAFVKTANLLVDHGGLVVQMTVVA